MAFRLHYLWYMRTGLEVTKSEIRSVYLGSENKPSNVAREYPRLYSKARKHFGSWKNALEQSGVDYYEARNYNKWTKNKITLQILKLYFNGHSLKPSDLKNGGNIKLVSAALYHFGSWHKAVESCRINYQYKRKKRIAEDGHKKKSLEPKNRQFQTGLE